MRRLVVCLVGLLAVVTACSDKSKSGTGPPPATYSIVISAPDTTLIVGQSSQLTAQLTRSDGAAVTDASVSWTSSDNSIAEVIAAGLVLAKDSGSATITAKANGASATLNMHVVPSPRANAAQIVAESVYVGQTIDLRAYLLANGSPAFMDSATWTSSDPTVGTVAGGVFAALKRGVSTVKATQNGKTGVVDVLSQTHVKSLTLSPDTLPIPLYASSAFDATVTDSAGSPVYGRAITWSIADTTKLKVSNGILTAKVGGFTTVTAVCEGAVAMAVVRITTPTAFVINISAPRGWVGVGKTLALTSDVRDAGGAAVPGAAVSWTSSDSTVARVSATGVVTGVARGKTTILASVAGHQGTFNISVEQPVASIVFVPDSAIVALHGALQLSATLRDADGNTLASRTLVWTSSDTNIVSIATSPFWGVGYQANARATGRAILSATIDGVVGTLPVIVSSSTDQLHFEYPTATSSSYYAYDTRLYMEDHNGASLSGRAVTMQSSDPGILSVHPDTGTITNGLMTVHVTTGHAGDVILSATSGTVSTNYLVHVVTVPVTLKIVFKPAELPVGKSYRLTTTVIGTDGQAHINPVDWSTSDPSLATVSDSGVVTPLSGGVVRIIARARDAQFAAADTATIGIRAQQAPLVTGVSPTELQAGGTATLTGQNFSATAAANSVTIDGVPAQVTAATTTQLSITLPSSTSFVCQPTHVAPLVVSTGPGLVSVSQQMLASAPQQSLAVGDGDFWSPADSRCNELAKGHGVYLLTISNGGTSVSSTTGFSFMVDTGTVVSTTLASSGARIPSFSRSVAPTLALRPNAPGVIGFSMDSLRRAAMAHRDLLERSRKLAANLGSPLPALRRANRMRLSADVIATASNPTPGTMLFLRVPRIDTPEFCGDYRTVQARVVYNGTHSIILEDVQAPIAGLMDKDFEAVGAEFDQTTFDIIKNNFGDPLAMDTSLGGPGKVTMLFTPAVNAMGPTGFVVSCDFYPPSSVPSSNQREMFYAVVPTSSATGFNGEFTADAWKHIIRGTIAHETKHIASMAEHFARQAPQQEESWLEEGTAMHAMELWARTVTSMKWKGANSYSTAPYCDVRPTWPSCNGQPYTMFDHFAYLHDFLTPSEQHTPLGSTDPSDASFYGSVWWLVRWAIDQYATDEGAFLRALTQEPSLTGVANLSARTGRSWPDLVRDWSLATLTSYQAPSFTPHDQRLTTPTWRLRDVFDGMASDFPTLFGTGGMLTWHGQYCATSPTVIHAMPPGGISLYYLDTCDGWKNFFRFQSDLGGSPSSALSIGVVRIQ